MSVSPRVIIEVDGLVLLVRPSFLRSYFCRFESASAVIICRTSGELGSIGSMGGKGLMVISAQIGWWVVGCKGKCSFRLMPLSNCQLRRRLWVAST